MEITQCALQHGRTENGRSYATSMKSCVTSQPAISRWRGAAGDSDKEKSWELPDGNINTADAERFRCPQLPFQPSFIGKDTCGVHDTFLQRALRSASSTSAYERIYQINCCRSTFCRGQCVTVFPVLFFLYCPLLSGHASERRVVTWHDHVPRNW